MRKPLLMLGIGGLLGLAYTVWRDRKAAADATATPAEVFAPADTPMRVTGGGFSGAGMNTTTVPQQSTPLPAVLTPLVTPADGTWTAEQWAMFSAPDSQGFRPDYDIENRTPEWGPEYRYGPEPVVVNGGTQTGDTPQTISDPVTGDPSTPTYRVD